MNAPVMDDQVYALFLAELAEYQFDNDNNPAVWDVFSWVGGDYNRIWFKSEGAAATTRNETDGDLQVLYGRLITPWWDLQVGVRGELQLDGSDTRGRVFGAIGVQGLAPGFFDVEATVFVSDDGDVSARFTVEYSSYLTQRLVAEPRLEIDGAIQEVENFGVGSGPNLIELGLRLRYEIRRELAPYIGVNWNRALLDTADFTRERGEDASTVSVVAGMRVWY